METISIEILNPKAKQLLKDLAAMNLISIRPKSTFFELLAKMRKKDKGILSLEEITAEVELVRQARNEKKA